MKHGIYKGPAERLQGKGALLRETPDEATALVQFDGVQLPESFGWHAFPWKDFEHIYRIGDDFGNEGQ